MAEKFATQRNIAMKRNLFIVPMSKALSHSGRKGINILYIYGVSHPIIKLDYTCLNVVNGKGRFSPSALVNVMCVREKAIETRSRVSAREKNANGAWPGGVPRRENASLHFDCDNMDETNRNGSGFQ